ncbi:MAG: helix-turn-helix domain-containing protein [Polyangiales bacterium]
MDDLDKYVAERERREPGFEKLVANAERRQAFARELAQRRRSAGKTQTQVAAIMETSASIVSRLESGSDVRISTLEKYVAAIGMELDFRAVPPSRRTGGRKERSSKSTSRQTSPKANG